MENLKNEILKALTVYELSDELIDENLLICNITKDLEEKDLINFSYNYRETESDSWLQCEYYSEKLNKAIIFDYDAPSFFDDFDDISAIEKFADVLAETQQEIIKFESKINFTK